MTRYATLIATVLLYVNTLGSAVAQQISAEPLDSESVAVGIQAEVMPPVPEPDPASITNNKDMAPALLNDQNSVALAVNENPSESATTSIEMKLVTRGIYQCRDGNRTVFVDEENRAKYRECTQIRAPYYEQATETNTEPERAPCSGAIVYKGSTYVFNDHEPCPIPEEIFEARKPIEANPEYYTQPTS